MTQELLRVEGLGRAFPTREDGGVPRWVIRDMSFSVADGEFVTIMGPSGAGKTTLAGKLAKWLKGQGHTPLLVACDLQRPGAVTQLKIVGEPLGTEYFGFIFKPGSDLVAPFNAALARMKDDGTLEKINTKSFFEYSAK